LDGAKALGFGDEAAEEDVVWFGRGKERGREGEEGKEGESSLCARVKGLNVMALETGVPLGRHFHVELNGLEREGTIEEVERDMTCHPKAKEMRPQDLGEGGRRKGRREGGKEGRRKGGAPPKPYLSSRWPRGTCASQWQRPGGCWRP